MERLEYLEEALEQYGDVTAITTGETLEITIKGFKNTLSNVSEVATIIVQNTEARKIKHFNVKNGEYRIVLKY